MNNIKINGKIFVWDTMDLNFLVDRIYYGVQHKACFSSVNGFFMNECSNYNQQTTVRIKIALAFWIQLHDKSKYL